jgi:RimJ/RimL family protein N-acetyltransferase
VLKPDYPIRTERLLLRPFIAADAERLHAYRSQPEVVRYLLHDVQSLEQMTERVNSAHSTLEKEGDVISLAVVEADSGVLVGDVVLFWRNVEHRGGEIGYVFDPAFAGRGFATEASRAMLELAFDGLGLHRVVGRLDARNVASGRVLERLGMRREAYFISNEYLKDEWTDEIIYAVLEDEWAAQRVDQSIDSSAKRT